MDVRDKTLVVTGAGRGIGRALALHFARSGAQLALIDTNSEGLAETQRRCTEEGSTARSYLANVAREAEVVSTFAQVASEFGRLDGLINNAGVVRDALLVKVKDGKLIDKMSLEQWQAVIDVNLTGVFLCAREAATHMIRLGHGGVIVNISEHFARGQPRPDQLFGRQGRRRLDGDGVGQGTRALSRSVWARSRPDSSAPRWWRR